MCQTRTLKADFLKGLGIWKENRKKLREQTNEMRQIACVHELIDRF